MSTLPAPVSQFLHGHAFAVVGVSRDPHQAANAVFRKLKASGYDVFPVNPNATEVEGTRAYPDIGSIGKPLDGVVIATAPQVALKIVQQCHEHGVPRVWFHRSFGEGSVSDEAVQACRDDGIDCIVGGCPMMYCDPVDFGHRCMRWWLQRQGRVPR
jgi:predicted CoA-binding protein